MGHDNRVFGCIMARLRHCTADGPQLPDCLDDRSLAAYIDNRLPEEQQARFVAHLADCRHCRQVVTASAAPPVTPPAHPPQTIPSKDRPEQADAIDPLVLFEMELANMEASLGIRPLKPETDARPHILIVDDDVIYLNALVSILSTEFHVTACGSGQEALKRVDDDICTIVLDIRMAGLDGLAVADRLKDDRRAVPIIFNTGYPGDFVREDIENHYRPYGYITKDDPERLLACVRRAAGSQTGLPA